MYNKYFCQERGHTNVAIVKKLSHKISSWYTHENTHCGKANTAAILSLFFFSKYNVCKSSDNIQRGEDI